MSAEVEKLSNGVTLSLSALSQEFGYARETVRKRLDNGGVRPDGARRGNPVYRLRDCIQALTEIPGTGSIEDPQTLPPMERRAWYASEKDKLFTDEKKGVLMPIEEHRESLAMVVQTTVQILETLTDVLERDAEMTPGQIVRTENIIDDIRNRWADMLEGEEE